MSVFSPPKESIPNYHFIQLDVSAEAKEMQLQAKRNLLQNAESDSSNFFAIPEMLMEFTESFVNNMKHPKVAALKQYNQFDLVVFGYLLNDYELGMAAHFKCPSVIVSGTQSMASLRNMVGNPSGIAYTPYAYLLANGPMTFFTRVLHFLITVLEQIVFKAIDSFIYQP